MEFRQFHFAQDAWLWGLLVIPVVLLLYAVFYKIKSSELLERFADRHLLPHLVKKQGAVTRTIRMSLIIWALAWLCGMVAMAGPRWNYTDEPTFQTSQDIVVVLDLSQSMNATDVKPSRIARAREEIEDLLDMSRGYSIGLVAYAAVPHMVTPLTDDVRTIRNLLPALDTSLVTIQGDRLKPALEMAAGMLKAEPGDGKSILVISDGDFQENNFAELARAAGGARIFAMGVGSTSEQAPKDTTDALQDIDGNTSISPLKADRLQNLAEAGHGLYVEANYTDSDTRAILDHIASGNDKAHPTTKSVRVWEDSFYIPALALALLLLPLFRKGASLFLVILLVGTVSTTEPVHAADAADLFLNKEQQARAAYNKGDYKDAMAKFDTPYRRGVAAYRAGKYDEAAALFKIAAAQNNNLDALYNLGNAQLLQGAVSDAVADYEAVLKQRPGDAGARHNLDIALKMLAKNKQQQPPKNPPKDKKGQGDGQNNQQSQKPQQQGKNGQPNQGGQKGAQDKQNRPPPQQSKSGQQTNQSGKNSPQTGQPNSDGLSRPAQDSSHQAKSQQSKQQLGQQQPGKAQPASAPQNLPARAAAAERPRAQRDVNADEWLGRVQNDPGSFLKNQFMIEERESTLQQVAPP